MLSENGSNVSSEATSPEVFDPKQLLQDELAYISTDYAGQPRKHAKGLTEQYNDPSVSPQHVQAQLKEFARKRKVDDIVFPEKLSGQQLNPENLAAIDSLAEQLTKRLFLNMESGSYNREKHEKVLRITREYIELTARAIHEGDLNPNLTAGVLWEVVQENILKLAFQDRAAMEVPLGDHGVRHISYDIQSAREMQM